MGSGSARTEQSCLHPGSPCFTFEEVFRAHSLTFLKSGVRSLLVDPGVPVLPFMALRGKKPSSPSKPGLNSPQVLLGPNFCQESRAHGPAAPPSGGASHGSGLWRVPGHHGRQGSAAPAAAEPQRRAALVPRGGASAVELRPRRARGSEESV